MSRLRSVYGEGGILACEHRELTVCRECFAGTPDLIRSYGMTYRLLTELSNEFYGGACDSDPEHIYVSPGSRAGKERLLSN